MVSVKIATQIASEADVCKAITRDVVGVEVAEAEVVEAVAMIDIAVARLSTYFIGAVISIN